MIFVRSFLIILTHMKFQTTVSSTEWSEILNQKQIIPKLNKDGTQISTVSSSATQVLGSHEKANNNLGMEIIPNLIQCKFLEIFAPNSNLSQGSKNIKRTIFVICSNKGIFVSQKSRTLRSCKPVRLLYCLLLSIKIYEDDCVNLIYFQNYRNMKSSQAGKPLAE